MADVLIRQATVKDVDALVDIHRQARDTYYRGVIPDEELDDPTEHAEMRAAYERGIGRPDRDVRCAEQDGAVVGFATLGPPFEPVVDADPQTVGQLFGLYVKPSRWGRRVGGSLHEESVGVWQSTGITIARLEVWERNERALTFYLRRGWQPDGRRRPGAGDSSFVRLCLAVAAG
jgi:ribosomal protein S18 acetylase RimI-like enzyme